MVRLFFTPQCAYTISPYKWTYRLSLGFIESWPDLLGVAKMAQERGGYHFDYSGIAHATRPERTGQMRFWRWQWSEKGKKKGKARSYHFPECDYLATLVALLRVRGELAAAEAVAESAQQPLPEVQLLALPDPYDIYNYSYDKEYTYDAKQCLRMILDQRDFALTTKRAVAREGFGVEDGSRLAYRDDGTILLTLQRGHTQHVSEELYGHLLRSAQEEVEKWTASH